MFDEDEFVTIKVKMKTWFHLNKRRRTHETDNELIYRILYTGGEPL